MDCSIDASMCHENAQCAYVEGRYACKCNDEFVGNGTFCKERPNIQGGFVLLNKGRSTLRLPLQPGPHNSGAPIHFHNDQVPIGITIDCVDSRVYWSDIAKKTIHSSNYDGSDMQEFITEGIDSSEGLAVDWVHRDLYWTDSGNDIISKANLDTKEKTVIVSEGLVNPRGIAVHPWKRKIYWSDWDRVDPKIESANLDGRNRAVLLKGHFVRLPNSLAIDWNTDELCWADAGTSSIECLKLSTGQRRSAVKGCKYPFGLTITPEKYYWTDWVTHQVESADKDGIRREPLQLVFGGDDKLYGIAAVTNSCP